MHVQRSQTIIREMIVIVCSLLHRMFGTKLYKVNNYSCGWGRKREKSIRNLEADSRFKSPSNIYEFEFSELVSQFYSYSDCNSRPIYITTHTKNVMWTI